MPGEPAHPMPVRPRPCGECPWVRATAPGQFPPDRYEALRGTTGGPGAEAPLGAPLFACHKSHEGRDLPCAGWLAAVGNESLTVRVLVATGRIPAAALAPGADWPALFDSYEEMAAAMGGRGEDRPMADEPTVPKGLTPAEIKIIVVAEGRDAGTWGEGDTLAAAMYESGRPRFYRAYLATPGTTADNRGPGRAMLCTPDHPPKEFHSNLPPAPPRAPAARGKAAGKGA